MRNAFADEVTKIGAENTDVVLLSGDIGNRLFDNMKAACEGRVINCGVAEANMMGLAAGMALNGLKPIVYTITPFTTTRCLEQIRVDVCYHEAPVVIVGTGAGLSYAQLGPTHHSVEDIALLRTLPGMTVLCPCDQMEVRAALRAAVAHDGPVYMRIGKKGEPQIHEQMPDFKIGKAMTMRDGSDVCLISTGNMMKVVLDAADLLAGTGVKARVEGFPTVKPLDGERLAELFDKFPLIAVAEEHSRIGGLAASIAEWLIEQRSFSGQLMSFGTADEFMHVIGSQNYARAHFGLTAEHIAGEVGKTIMSNAAVA
ncbi:MAG: transketolase C-terminal domain-containing protein [Pseudomonadota bacterium]